MNVVCTTEKRYFRTPDGKVWTATGGGYTYWSRYLAVFDCVKVVARVLDVEQSEERWQRADGNSVYFCAVPYYLGPSSYIRKFRGIKKVMSEALEPGDAVVLCAGGPMSAVMESIIRRMGYPYGVHVVGDPYNTFRPGAFKHPLRPLLRWYFTRELERQCRNACAAQYVTSSFLQGRYPCPGFSVSASDVELPNSAIVERPRLYTGLNSPIRLITIGTMEVMYKAPDVLIESVARCVRSGLDLTLTFIGDGVHRSMLEAMARDCGIGERTTFLGQLPAGQAVFAELDKADLFVLPSHCEGLPRAMIEAMARALPCIGTRVGGIPELLPPEDMVRPGSVSELSSKIHEVVTDPERMSHMSARNLWKAREYTESIMRERMLQFYNYLKEKTLEWVTTRLHGV
ncbi:MAG: glycosyltransferase family 4 protein [Armatimonadota bacterium]